MPNEVQLLMLMTCAARYSDDVCEVRFDKLVHGGVLVTVLVAGKDEH